MSHSFASMAQVCLALAAIVGVAASHAANAQTTNILSLDRLVEHTSTVPAIKGEKVSLFVRERIAASMAEQPAGAAFERKVVLMVHGGFCRRRSPSTFSIAITRGWSISRARASTYLRWT